MKHVLVLLTMVLGLFCSSAQSQNVNTYIPPRALALLDDISKETKKYAPELEGPWYIAALYEHESCLSLTHSRCYKADSEYKAYDKTTGRLIEQGVGLSMTTRAWRSNGELRMDTLANMKKTYRTALGELTWDNIKERPDLQIRLGILLTMENWRALPTITDPVERLAMTDAAYNGGIRDLRQERTLCGLKPNCDPQKWFGHVEHIVYKSTVKTHNGRSSYEVNRHHVKDVLKTRMPKYKIEYHKRE